MVKKKALELWSLFKERLSPTDLKTLTSLLIDSNRRKIDKTQLVASALLLFKKDEFLHSCFTDFIKKSHQEEKEMSEVESESLTNFCKMACEELRGPSELLTLVSSIKDFDKHKIRLSQFRKSLPPLFKNNRQEDELEEGEIREDRDPKVEQDCHSIRAKLGQNSKEDPKNEIRVSEEVKDVRHCLQKMNLEGKKRRILLSEPIERSLKKPRTSRRLERVTHSYRLIPKEERCPVSYNVLNNKYSLMKFDDPSGSKELSKYEEAMARCEDYMFEADVLMGNLKSAVESAEKVLSEEMEVEELGVKFYRCIEWLYRGDMFEIVREDYKEVLPVVLKRLKQKVDELTVARDSWIPMWKQVFEENTAKQRESYCTSVKATGKSEGKQKILDEDKCN